MAARVSVLMLPVHWGECTRMPGRKEVNESQTNSMCSANIWSNELARRRLSLSLRPLMRAPILGDSTLVETARGRTKLYEAAKGLLEALWGRRKEGSTRKRSLSFERTTGERREARRPSLKRGAPRCVDFGLVFHFHSG